MCEWIQGDEEGFMCIKIAFFKNKNKMNMKKFFFLTTHTQRGLYENCDGKFSAYYFILR